MDIRVKTKCPYCGHVNDTPVAVTSADVYQRFVVNCDDAADGGCGCDYVATARIRVVSRHCVPLKSKEKGNIWSAKMLMPQEK